MDGSLFTIDQAEEMRYALAQFFSFIQGEWSGPIFCKGKLDGKITWEQWGNPHITSFRYQTGIAQARQFDQNKAFKGFMNKWTDEKWKETLKIVIYFYVEANIMPTIEGSIILLQAALERLTWAAGSKNKDAERLRHADERINWLLGEMELPIELPSTMVNLWKYADKTASKIQYPNKAKKENRKLGAYILSYLRNGIVHPDEKFKRWTNAKMEEKWDAKRLGLWYIATILLRLMDYYGEYMSPVSWQNERMPSKD